MLCVDKLKVLLKAARERAVVPLEGFDQHEGGEASDAELISPVTVTTQATNKSKQKQKKKESEVRVDERYHKKKILHQSAQPHPCRKVAQI